MWSPATIRSWRDCPPHDQRQRRTSGIAGARPSEPIATSGSLWIDPSNFSLGTGPKPDEIWHGGDYPVAWTNTKYRMVYMNMGHNDLDYGGTNRATLVDYSSPAQNEFITRALVWLGTSGR